jgi:hypothetical protein
VQTACIERPVKLQMVLVQESGRNQFVTESYNEKLTAE